LFCLDFFSLILIVLVNILQRRFAIFRFCLRFFIIVFLTYISNRDLLGIFWSLRNIIKFLLVIFSLSFLSIDNIWFFCLLVRLVFELVIILILTINFDSIMSIITDRLNIAGIFIFWHTYCTSVKVHQAFLNFSSLFMLFFFFFRLNFHSLSFALVNFLWARILSSMIIVVCLATARLRLGQIIPEFPNFETDSIAREFEILLSWV